MMDEQNKMNDAELDEVAGGVKQDTGNYLNYTVVKGDTLTRIAHRFDTTIDLLVKINHIKDRNLIIIGQVLKIPV